MSSPTKILEAIPGGLVERALTPKEGYYVFQSYWAERPMVHIYGHNWPVRWGDAGEPKMIKVYSNCPQVELFVNGQSLGVRERELHRTILNELGLAK